MRYRPESNRWESDSKMTTRRFILLGLAALAAILSTSVAQGVALSDQVIQQKRDAGELESWVKNMEKLRAAGWDQPAEPLFDDNLALGAGRVTTHKVLVILIDFSDMSYMAGYAAATPQAFDSLLFSDGINPTGSMKEFFLQNSFGQYDIQGTVAGWYHSPVEHDWYTDGTLPVSHLITLAVQEADKDVDFRQFDNNGDGYVEGVIVVHAGTGHEESGDPADIHSHSSNIAPILVDSVYVNRYTIQPEETAIGRGMNAIGVFCHEWGHILGLPDLYDTDYSSQGVGRWSLMGSGNYNGSSRLPANLDAWSKDRLAWLDYTNVMANTTGVQIPAAAHNAVAYRLNLNGSWNGPEYWVAENRYRTGFDAALPAGGLIIYHINSSSPGNYIDWQPIVMVEQADGRFDLQYNRNNGDGGDVWPAGGTARIFHDKTVPDSKYYQASRSSQVGVWNISDVDSVMTADFEVKFSRPWIEKQGVAFLDNVYGNGNGICEAGEKIQVRLALTNDWGMATGVTATLTTDDPNLNVVTGTSAYPDISTGGTASNASNPFEFEIPSEYNSRIDSFYFQVSAAGGAYQTTLAEEMNIGRPQVLIVDDDGGDAANLENYLALPLYNRRAPAEMHDVNLLGAPAAAKLLNYPIVMWMTGDYRSNLLSAAEVDAMTGYMDGGGNLFLTGQGLARQLNDENPNFLADYLRTQFIDSTKMQVMEASTGPVSGGMKSIITFGTSGANNQTVYDHNLPVNGGVGEWQYLNSSPVNYGAISYSGTYKLVFFAFGFEAIKSDDVRFETRNTVMARVIDFLGDLPTDVEDGSDMAVNLPARFIMDQNRPNPFNPVTTISYVITGAAGGQIDRTRLDVYNVLGQQVTTLVDRDEAPGVYSVIWDGRDDKGREAASGVYFYRLTRGVQSEAKKMMLLK